MTDRPTRLAAFSACSSWMDEDSVPKELFRLSMPLTVLNDQGEVETPTLGQSDEISPFVAEIEEVLAAVQSGTASSILGGDLARDAIILAHRQAESVAQGGARVQV